MPRQSDRPIANLLYWSNKLKNRTNCPFQVRSSPLDFCNWRIHRRGLCIFMRIQKHKTGYNGKGFLHTSWKALVRAWTPQGEVIKRYVPADDPFLLYLIVLIESLTSRFNNNNCTDSQLVTCIAKQDWM